jgi:hypothetical protein
MPLRDRPGTQLTLLLAVLLLLALFIAHRWPIGSAGPGGFAPIATPPAPAPVPRIGR